MPRKITSPKSPVSKQKRRQEEIRRLVKSACKLVVAPPEYKKRLLELLMREVPRWKRR